MCHTNMGGHWELQHLPYDGGYYEQPAPIIDEIEKVITYMNTAIKEKNDKEDD